MPPPPQRKLHLTNSKGRDATVFFGSLKPSKGPRRGLVGHDVVFTRYLASAQSGTHEVLAEGSDEEKRAIFRRVRDEIREKFKAYARELLAD